MLYGLHSGGAICSAERELRTIATRVSWENEKRTRCQQWRFMALGFVSTSRVSVTGVFFFLCEEFDRERDTRDHVKSVKIYDIELLNSS